MRITKKKIAIVGSAVAVLALSGTGAMAFWTTGGSGTGSATAGTTANIKINQTSTITGMYPGMTPVALAGNFDNANPGTVRIAGVVVDLATTSVTSAGDNTKPACSVSDFDFTGTSAANIDVISGTGVGAWSGLNVALKQTAANQDNCKNQTLTIGYKVG